LTNKDNLDSFNSDIRVAAKIRLPPSANRQESISPNMKKAATALKIGSNKYIIDTLSALKYRWETLDIVYIYAVEKRAQ
jgi:hypothetical protein